MSTGKWDENRIRQEIKRLDKITGLDGASLPISFSNSHSYLGMFHGGDNMRFQFSNYYFLNPRYSDETLLDTVRHEYSHMANYVLNGGATGHGKSWKIIASKLGATPVRLYNDRINKIERNAEKEKELLIERLKEYHVNQRILHPYFDEGVIQDIFEDGEYSIASINFEKEGIKRITLKWIDENCIIIS